ncbi:MAG: hypothetical protein AVDCRST_MAG87-1967, partial [uncultured Thermomicrobiales bacterium]
EPGKKLSPSGNLCRDRGRRGWCVLLASCGNRPPLARPRRRGDGPFAPQHRKV